MEDEEKKDNAGGVFNRNRCVILCDRPGVSAALVSAMLQRHLSELCVSMHNLSAMFGRYLCAQAQYVR